MLHSLKQMRVQMRERLPSVPLTNEAAYRAFYVTPLLFAALDHFRFKMNIAYAISGGWLTGTVAYLLRGRSQQDDIKREGARLSWANS